MREAERLGSIAYFLCVTLVLSSAVWLQTRGQEPYAFGLMIGSGVPVAWLAERRRPSQRPGVARAAISIMIAASGCAMLLLLDGSPILGAALLAVGYAALLIAYRIAPPTEEARRQTAEAVHRQAERLGRAGLAKTMMTHGVLPGTALAASFIVWIWFQDGVWPPLWNWIIMFGLMAGGFALIAAFGWWVSMRLSKG